MKFTLQSVCRETGRMTALKSGAKRRVSVEAMVISSNLDLCDFAVTKVVPSRRLYGDTEPGIFDIITLERWRNGQQIYKRGRK